MSNMGTDGTTGATDEEVRAAIEETEGGATISDFISEITDFLSAR